MRSVAIPISDFALLQAVLLLQLYLLYRQRCFGELLIFDWDTIVQAMDSSVNVWNYNDKSWSKMFPIVVVVVVVDDVMAVVVVVQKSDWLTEVLKSMDRQKQQLLIV